MGYQIYFDDVSKVKEQTNQSMANGEAVMVKLSDHMTSFTAMSSLQGAAAESVKSYLTEVHGTLLTSILELFIEYQSRYLLFKDELFELDSDLHARLDEATFDNLLTFFPGSQTEFQGEVETLQTTIETISDLIGDGCPSDTLVNDNYGTLIQTITDLREDAGTCDQTHASNDLTSFEALLSAFKELVATYQGQGRSVVIGYQSGSLATIPEGQQIRTAYDQSQKGRNELRDQLTEALGREQKRMELRAAEVRRDEGIWQAVSAVLTVMAGATAIILTAGAATPIVVVAAVSGSASIGYGLANGVEAGQNIYYGAKGDSHTLAFNPLRDTVFMGNQTAYDMFGLTATFVAGSMIPINSAVTLAQANGASLTKAVIMGIGQSLAATGAGLSGGKAGAALGYKLGEKLFVSDDRSINTLSHLAELTGGFAAGYGAYKVSGQAINKSLTIKHAPENYTLPKEAQQVLNKHGLTIEEFNKINAKQVKTPEEINLLKAMREQISNPTKNTDMRKVIPVEYVDGMINNPKYGNVGGFVTEQKYVKDITAVNDVIDSSRLDYEGTYFKKGGDYAYVDFVTKDISKANVPYSPEFGGSTSDPWPFTGSGFTAGENGTMVPEWQVPKNESMEPGVGSTLHMVIDGKDNVVAEYKYNPFKKEGYWKDLRK